MEYNTQMEKLAIREYGRNVQNMVDFAKTLEDKEKRQKFAEGIVTLMGQMVNSAKDNEDEKQKLWSHLFYMADYELDVVSPYEIEKSSGKMEIGKVDYPQDRIRYKHYGRNVESMIAAAKATEDPEKKNAYAEVIGNYMRMVYQNWSQENIAAENVIADLKDMSKGELVLSDEANLDILAKPIRKKSMSSKNRKGGSNNNRGRNKGRQNNNQKRRRR